MFLIESVVTGELILLFSSLIAGVCVLLVLLMTRVSHNQPLHSLSSPPLSTSTYLHFWWSCWRCLPSKTWPAPGRCSPEASVPTRTSWTWPVVTLESSSRLESSSQSDPSWLPVFTSFWPNFEIYSTGWIHLGLLLCLLSLPTSVILCLNLV